MTVTATLSIRNGRPFCISVYRILATAPESAVRRWRWELSGVRSEGACASSAALSNDHTGHVPASRKYSRTTGAKLSQGEAKALEPEIVAEWFDFPADRWIAGEQVKLIQDLNESTSALEKKVEAMADQLPRYHYIQGLPGIGRILALTISMETGPIARFPQDGQYASYCRGVPSKKESIGNKKGENNEKCGNQYLAWAYVEAAHFARRYDAPCRQIFLPRGFEGIKYCL